MKRKIILTVILTILAPLLLTACVTRQNNVTSTSPVKTVQSDGDDPEFAARIAGSVNLTEEAVNRLKVGALCDFIEDEKQSIPYRWRYQISDESLISVFYNDYEVRSGPNTMPGGDSADRMIFFEALAPGECEITLRYGGYGDDWDEFFLEEYVFTVVITE